MAYDEGVVQRVRECMEDIPDVIEKKMFGGVAFMAHGNMSVGVNGSELMVRVGAAAYEDALKKKHAREMDFTGRSLKGFIYVAEKGFESDKNLISWIQLAMKFVNTLPTK
jgi:TfoX/Sxy family transcriptional regulator of competence genes